MNREEILEKSRKEKQDEGMLNAENRGRKLGMVAFCIVFIAIMLINFCTGHSNHAPLAMFWAFLAAEAYPKYKFTGRKSYLVITVAGGLASLFALLNYLVEIMETSCTFRLLIFWLQRTPFSVSLASMTMSVTTFPNMSSPWTNLT